MANNIVTIAVSQIVAPSPSTLQSTGALVTQGGTTTTANTRTLLTRASDLTALLPTAKALTSLAWASNVVTGTTTAPHGYPNGITVKLTIAGAVPVAYNGTYTATITGTSTFTYPLTPTPGTTPASTPGTVTLGAVGELQEMVNTFFAQGDSQSVYVLELGVGTVAQGVTALTTYLTNNIGAFYSYLMPRAWADEATFVTLTNQYTSLTSRVYFFQTVTSSNYTSFLTKKSVVTMAESPTKPSGEFSLASMFYRTLAYNPSIASPVPQTAFGYLFGVTAYPEVGNGAQLATYKTTGVNVVGTGAEGGISNKVLFWGTAMDLADFTYWYAVDWVQINLDADIANEIINGANNINAPLYYNQDGINRLQARAQATLTRGVTFGLVLSPVVVTAVGFRAYVTANPSDYSTGTYNGLAATITIAKGFKSITFNLVVANFVLP